MCLTAIATVLVPMVDENQRGLRSLLKGTTKYYYWNEIARLVCFYLLSMILIAGIFVISTFMFDYWGTVRVIYPLLLIVLYVAALLSYTVVISLCFKKVETCKFAGILFYLTPFVFYQSFDDNWIVDILKYVCPSNIFFEGMKLVKSHLLTSKH